MKQMMLVIISIFLLCTQAYAEGMTRSQISSVPATERFEIIQSEIAARVTLKIDKYTGKVYQMVQGEKGVSWQLIYADKHVNDKIKKNTVNYQVFTSGIAVKMTYLLNVKTGATWQLSKSTKDEIFWAIVE